MKKYIGITQGCAGIISPTSDFGGLYTDKIKTCLGIALYMENGEVSLFHYDGQQSKQSIKNWLSNIEGITRCVVWCNPQAAHQDNEKKFKTLYLEATNKPTTIKSELIQDKDINSNEGACIYIKLRDDLPRGEVDWGTQKELHAFNMLNGHMSPEVETHIVYNNGWIPQKLNICFPRSLLETNEFIKKMVQNLEEDGGLKKFFLEKGLSAKEVEELGIKSMKEIAEEFLAGSYKPELDTYIPMVKNYQEPEEKKQPPHSSQPPEILPVAEDLDASYHGQASQLELVGQTSPADGLD